MHIYTDLFIYIWVWTCLYIAHAYYVYKLEYTSVNMFYY